MGLLDRFRRKSPKRNKDTGTWIERYWKSFNHAIDGILKLRLMNGYLLF